MTEEEKARELDRLPQGEKDAQLEKKRLETLHYGWCQKCGRKILAFGKDWPKRCPHCGHGEPQGSNP